MQLTLIEATFCLYSNVVDSEFNRQEIFTKNKLFEEETDANVWLAQMSEHATALGFVKKEYGFAQVCAWYLHNYYLVGKHIDYVAKGETCTE